MMDGWVMYVTVALAMVGAATITVMALTVVDNAITTVRAWRDAWYRERTRRIAGRP